MVLHRPSPSFPVPTAPVLDICLGAARGVIRISDKVVSAKTEQDVMPGWAGFHSVFMAGLTLLYCSWWVMYPGSADARACATCENAIRPSATGAGDPDLLAVQNILDTLATRYNQTLRYGNLFRRLCETFARLVQRMWGIDVDLALSRDAAGMVAEDNGLVNLDELVLNPDAVELINQLLGVDSGLGV
jgi:hypothetical protein